MTVTNYFVNDINENLLSSLLKVDFVEEKINSFGRQCSTIVPKFKTVMTFDTETSTVMNGELSPLKVERKIKLGENNIVTTNDTYKEYSFICAWTFAITNDGENYYSILGRTITEFKNFFNMIYDCVKKVLIQKYNERLNNCDDEKESKKIKDSIKSIKKGINKNSFKGLNIWVHNLTYDYYFIKDCIIDKFARFFGKRNKIMKVDYEDPKYEYTVNHKNGNVSEKTHKGLKHITFRDSLAYYDCKLDDLPSKYFNKTDGWDYDKFRLPTTPLSDLEDEYARNDTLKLAECIYNTQQEFINKEIPLTKTSNDRQILRGTSQHITQDPELMLAQQETFKSDVKRIELLNKENVTTIIDKNGKQVNTFKDAEKIEFYDQCLRTMFAGGITQGNIFHINDVDTDVTSFDVASMYPFIMRTHKFVYRYNKEITNEKIIRNRYLNEKRDYKNYFEGKYDEGWFAIVKIENLEIKTDRGISDLSSDLFRRTKDYLLTKYPSCMDNLFDSIETYVTESYNGKIRRLESGYIILNDIDYTRLNLNYKFKITKILHFRVGKYENIPKCLENLLDNLAYDKIKYKELLKRAKAKGDSMEIEDYENKLGFSKKCFNGSYGMLVENKVRQKIEELADILNLTTTEVRDSDEFKKEYRDILYSVYGDKPKLPTTYEMGVQTTAFARLYWVYTSNNFEKDGINEVLYGDTDSQKVIGDSYKFIMEWNEYIELTIKTKFQKVVDAWTFDNEFHCLGVWENEGKYPLFRQYGAKRYMHTNYYPDNKTIEIIYTWYERKGSIIRPYEKRYKELTNDIKKLVCHKVKSIEVVKTWNKNTKSFETTDLLTDSDIKKIEKDLNVKCKIEEKMSVTFAGINPKVLEYHLYSNYPNSRSRLNKLFDGNDGELKISPEESKKLTHTAVDLYKTRYYGKLYDALSIEVQSPVDSSSFVILKKQCYESNINSLVDAFKRIKSMDSSIVFRFQ